MNQAIRNAWTVTVLLFLVLVGAASYIQVIGAETLNNNEHNSRQIYQQFGSHRGPILVGGEPIAESVPTNSRPSGLMSLSPWKRQPAHALDSSSQPLGSSTPRRMRMSL